jgi:hypothetical protein
MNEKVEDLIIVACQVVAVIVFVLSGFAFLLFRARAPKILDFLVRKSVQRTRKIRTCVFRVDGFVLVF